VSARRAERGRPPRSPRPSEAAASGDGSALASGRGDRGEGDEGRAGPHDEGLLARWAFGPVAAVRPYLAGRFVLLLLAVDLWATHLGPAWRYGTAGFNVPHFDWVDRALPAPTAFGYVAMLGVLSAILAAAASLARPPAGLLGAGAALYLWGWSCSMHDSYQHHYLLSWMLGVIALLPFRPARELFGDPSRGQPQRAGAHWLVRFGSATLPHGPVPRAYVWRYRLLTSLAAVVYLYTAIAKLEPDWRSGDALRTLTHGGEDVVGMLSLLRSAGVEGDAVWPLLGAATIAIQVLVGLGYTVAPLADGDLGGDPGTQRDRRWSILLGFAAAVGTAAAGVTLATAPHALTVAPAVIALVAAGLALKRLGRRVSRSGVAQGVGIAAMFAAIAFHIGAEDMALEIGWFSYYMVGLAVVVLGPSSPLSELVAIATEPLRALDRSLDRSVPAGLVIGAAAASMVALVALGDRVLAGGGFEALAASAATIFALGVLALVRPALARPVVELAPGVIAVALSSFFLLGAGRERFDHFRFAGGDFRRRGEPAAALAAYRVALELAPDDERERIAARVRELEASLGAE
jgi:hypothetical protein